MNGRVGHGELCCISCFHLMWPGKGTGAVEVGCRVTIALKLSFVFFQPPRPSLMPSFSMTNLVCVCVLYLHYSFWKTFLHYLINFYKKKKLGK